MISRRVVVVWSIICLIGIVYALSGCASQNESVDLSETISPTQGTSERTRAATKTPTPKPGPTSTKTPYPTPTPEPPTTAVKWVAVLEVTDVHNLVAGMKRLVIVYALENISSEPTGLVLPGSGAFNHPPDAILKTEQGYEYEGQNMAQVRGGGSSPAVPGVRSWKISTAGGVMTFIQFDVAERTSGYVLHIEGQDPLPLASLPLITLSEGEFGNRDALLAKLLDELPDSYFPTSLPRDRYLKFGDILEVTDDIEMSVINSTFGDPGSGSIAGQRRFEFTCLLRNTSGGQAVRSPQLWITYVTNMGERDGPIQIRSSEIGPLQEQEVVQALSLDEQIHTVLLSVWTEKWEHVGTFYIP